MDKKKNIFSYIQYRDTMYLPDGIYTGKYNGEPAVIRMKDRIPVFIQRINTSIFEPIGILHSSVELLLPAQEVKFHNLST